jgi:hypothetical protein
MLRRALLKVFSRLKGWIFPGVWFAWRNREGSISLAGSEIPTDAGDTWVGLMGFGNLCKCSPLELTYQKEGQLYSAYLELKPGTFYILWGDRLLIEEIFSGETIPLTPAR